MRLLRLGQQDDTLEDNLRGIPTGLVAAVLCQSLLLGSLLFLALAGTFSLELFHRLCRRLDGNEEGACMHLDVLWVHGTAAHKLFQLCRYAVVDLHVFQRRKKRESLLDAVDECLVVEVSDV